MAIRTEQVSLDIQPCCDARGPVVCGRQGDEGTVLNVTVTQNGQAMPLDGLTATLLGNNPNLLQLVGTVSGSTATFTLPSAFFSAVCIVRLYVQLAQGEDVVASTQTFTLKVAPGADLSASQAQGYVPQLDEALATAQQASQTAETAAAQATQAVDDANTALQTANTAVQNANTATDAANAAASNANSAAQAARGNVLKGAVTDASVAHVEDAYAGAVAKEIRVKGETRQNLWSNPPTNTQNGITLTSNADGSLTLDGTASGASYFYVDVYCLKPGASYTLSLDRSVNASISVQSHGDSGYIADSVFVAAWSTSASGTVSQDAAKFRLMVQMNAGTTIGNVTVRVMLNEGSTARPWCPPGLSSVGELGIVSAGKNIAVTGDGLAELPHGNTARTIAAIYAKAGAAYTLSFLNTADWTEGPDGATVYVHNSNDDFVTDVSLGDVLIDFGTIAVGQRSAKDFVSPFDGVIYFKLKSKSAVADVMVEEGDADSAYSAPASMTPVDLSGHQLRSLPDGTCDVLTWDETGAVSVEQKLAGQSVAADGWTLYQSSYGDGTDLYCANVTGPKGIYGDYDQVICDAYATTNDSTASQPANTVRLSVDGTKFYLAVKSGTSPVACECVYQIYAQTVQLGAVAPPALPESTANVWAACDPPTELDLTYERDLTIAYDNLASQIATTAAALAVAQATD